jgi:serine/threonine-protein kinase
MFAKLVAITGPDTGKIIEVVPSVSLIVGRSREADARLRDPRASPFHCRIEVRDRMIMVTDMDSTVGTAVNNVFVLEYPLQFGDTLTIGDNVFLVQDPDAEAPLVQAEAARPARAGRMPSAPLQPKAEAPPPNSARAPKPAPAAVPVAKPAPAKAAAPEPAPSARTPKPASSPDLAPKAAAPPSANLPDRPEQLSGQAMAHFEVGPLIYRARSGLVFRAHDEKSNKTVALKVLFPSQTQTPESLQRFSKAMKLAMPLRHANIVAVLGAGRAGQYCWVAMELVNGESLTQTIRHVGVAGSLDWRRALRMSIYLARGLTYLHEQKVVYRSMGPQNVMVEGEAKVPRLSDFLRARPFFDPVDANAKEMDELPDSLLLYVSPEQTREETEIDYRSDIFNLGSLLYSLLTGHAPFEGGSLAETITKIRREKPENPKKFQLAIPEAFQGVVLQMLSKRPEDRYQTMAEALRDLERVLKYQGMTL